MSVFTGRDEQLVCGACEAVFAEVHLGPLASGITVRDLVSGAQLMPRNGFRVTAEAQARLAQAEAAAGDGVPPPDLVEARDLCAYLKRQAGEIIYDLVCRCGRHYLRASPHLRKEVRSAQGRWARLSPGTASWTPPPTD
jgi:hypothetical protein